MSKTAHIIALRASSVFAICGLGFGIQPLSALTTDDLLERTEVWTGPRPQLEEMPEFVQPIPNIVVKDGDKILSYVRSPKSGETRLHGKVAVGLGGHVDLSDVICKEGREQELRSIEMSLVSAQAFRNISDIIDLRATLDAAALRELEEELGIVLPRDLIEANPGLLTYEHVIHSQATPVDAVHIAFVVTLDISLLPRDQFNFEDALDNVQLRTPAELAAADALTGADRLELETWARLVVEQALADQG